MSKYAAVNVKFGADISQFSTAMQNAAREMKKAGDQLQNIGKSMTMNLTAPILALGTAALYTFGEIDSLKRGLIAFTGSAALAEDEFNKLREVAKLPGIGLEEAVRGSINLQAIGVSADEARKDMMAFGNAIATIGGGKENFDLAIRGFGQLTNASKPLQQDLYQIANQLPQINKILKETFGTNRAEELAAMGITGKQLADILVTELGKLPKVTGGIKNSFENMSDSVKISLAAFGEAIDKNFDISGKLDSFASWLGGLAQSFKELDPFWQKMILGVTGLVAAIGPLSFAIGSVIKILPMLITGFSVLTTVVPYLKWIALGFTVIVAAMEYFKTTTTAAADETKKLNNNIHTQTVETQTLFERLKMTNGVSGERNRLINEINSKYGTTLKNIKDEAAFLKQVETAYVGVIAKLKEKIVYESMQSQLSESIKKVLEYEEAQSKATAEAKRLHDEIDATNKTGATMGDITFAPAVAQTTEALRLSKLITEEQQKQQNLIKKGVKAFTPDTTTNTTPTKPLTEADKKELAARQELLEQNRRLGFEMLAENESMVQGLKAIGDKKVQVVGSTNKALIGELEKGGNRVSIFWNQSKTDWTTKLQELGKEIESAIKNSIVNTITDTFALIGENIAMGDDPFKNVGNVLLDSLGKLMATIGSAMIAMGVAKSQFLVSLATANPVGMILAGAAMVAAGSAISTAAKKGLKGSSSSGDSGGGGGNYGGNNNMDKLTFTTKLSGSDLVLAGERTSYIGNR